MTFTEKDLLRKKKEIEEAKTAISESKGELNILLKQLKDNWGCSSLEEAENKIKEDENKILKLNSKITKATKTLEEKYFNG